MRLFSSLPEAPSTHDQLERCYTPDALARWAVDQLDWHDGMRVLEPHAGGGAFLRALEARPERLVIGAMDIDPDCWSVRRRNSAVHDFLGPLGPHGPSCDRVIGNPPFSAAEDHVAQALRVAPDVAYILPVSRLETRTRMTYYRDSGLRSVTLLPDRWWPGSRQVALYRWHPGDGPPIIRFAL